VQILIPTKTGPRSWILTDEAGYKTASLSATTVSVLVVRSVSMYLSHNSPGKNLKKRLEDFERRAGSSSVPASQRPVHLSTSDSVATIHASSTTGLTPSPISSSVHQYCAPAELAQQDVIPSLPFKVAACSQNDTPARSQDHHYPSHIPHLMETHRTHIMLHIRNRPSTLTYCLPWILQHIRSTNDGRTRRTPMALQESVSLRERNQLVQHGLRFASQL
jgi:hypothetical protein